MAAVPNCSLQLAGQLGLAAASSPTSNSLHSSLSAWLQPGRGLA